MTTKTELKKAFVLSCGEGYGEVFIRTDDHAVILDQYGEDIHIPTKRLDALIEALEEIRGQLD